MESRPSYRHTSSTRPTRTTTDITKRAPSPHFSTPYSYLMNHSSTASASSSASSSVVSPMLPSLPRQQLYQHHYTPSNRSSESEYSNSPEEERFETLSIPSPVHHSSSTPPLLPRLRTQTLTTATLPRALLSPRTSSRPNLSPPCESTIELCFCGQPADIEEDEDAIYCSTACGRKDALSALCGTEEEEEEEDKVTKGGVVGGRSNESIASIANGSLGLGEREGKSSHYRRVELKETQRAIEKAKELGIKRTATGLWRYHKSDHGNKSPSPSSSSASSSPTLSRGTPTTPSVLDDELISPINPFPSTYISSSSYTTCPPPSTATAATTAMTSSSRPPLTRYNSPASTPMSRGATHAPSTSSSTIGSTAPSLSSSTTSYTSSSSRSLSPSSSASSYYDSQHISPLSPRFPTIAAHSNKTGLESRYDGALPSPHSEDVYANSDIYATYLGRTTPILNSGVRDEVEEHEQEQGRFDFSRFGPLADEEEADEEEGEGEVEAWQFTGRRYSSTKSYTPRRDLQEADEGEGEEEARDQVQNVLRFQTLNNFNGSNNTTRGERSDASGRGLGLGFGGSGGGGSGGGGRSRHQKGKLSFDDVMGIMQAS